MSERSKPKETSYEYGKSYQEDMLLYYHQSATVSDSNTEYLRLALAHELVSRYGIPRLAPKSPEEIVIVDIGCSVGMLAIDFAKKGFRSYGIDFDPVAINLASELNSQEGTTAVFLKMDVSDLRLDFMIDIALCFDIFEHLHDDEIGALFYGVKGKLSDKGCMVFHTLPLQYDYIFWDATRGIIQFPWFLRPFRNLSPERFTRIIEAFTLGRDLFYLIRGGMTHKGTIKLSSHCNPFTRERLEDILRRAGYDIIFISTGFLSDAQLDPRDRESFNKQPITHRSMWGVAAPKSSG